MDGIKEQRQINIRHAHTSHDVEGVEVTDPVRVRPTNVSRREWREALRQGYRAVRRQELENRRAEAAVPESVKLDRRFHAAGLVSPRDMGRIIPVKLDRIIEI